jgi:MATE family multidrug resistance protein
VIFSVAYGFGWRQIIGLMTNNEQLIADAANYAIWIGLVPLLAFASFLWDGIYIGATASVQMRNSMLLATGVVFFPTYFLLQNSLGNHALWIALLGFLLVRGVAQYIMAGKAVYKKVP